MHRRGGGTPFARFFSIGVWVLLIALGSAACGRKAAEPRPGGVFRDAARETGLIFQHHNGMSGKRYLPEMVGSGVALLDYDNDGDLDVFLVQGGVFEPGPAVDGGPASRPALFRNDLRVMPDGRRVLHFTGVTEQAGLGSLGYGMGVAAADFDGDGFVDLFVTSLRTNHLLRNLGNGAFREITASAGLAAEGGWATSASWVDIDRDGHPDLYVCYYLLWTFGNHKSCRSPGGVNDYCGPKAFPPARSRLFRNLGNGQFQDISLRSRIAGKAGSALGVVAADLTGDGWPDLFVANDGMENFLWVNRQDGSFAEEALERGAALDLDGATAANMGVVAADFENRGLDNLFVTHLMKEHATYYRNLGGGQFEDVTASVGLDAPTRPFTGFGTVAIDYDNDGWQDLFAANGEVRIIDEQLRAGVALPLRQRALLFHNRGAQLGFEEIKTGDFLKLEEVGRGVAVGDLDNDGRADLVVTNNAGPARVLLNQAGPEGTGKANSWLGLRLVDGPAGRRRDALGAAARVERAGEPALWRRVATDGSYLSSSDPRLLFGLGASPAVDRILVTWQDGKREEWRGIQAGRYHELVRGSGRDLGAR